MNMYMYIFTCIYRVVGLSPIFVKKLSFRWNKIYPLSYKFYYTILQLLKIVNFNEKFVGK